jgi:AmmeMemoRadiSam system protein B
MVLTAVHQQHTKVHTFVIFGAAHGYFGREPVVFDSGVWNTPLGDVVIDEDLARQVLAQGPGQADTHAHLGEHSIEVEVPLIQHLFPGSKILPIIVPPTEQAVTLGTTIAKLIAESDRKIVCIGSTDLTHYGPRYGFTPMGNGAEALKWASEVNDRKFIDLALAMQPEEMLVNAAENGNACGAGAAAAAVAAAKESGKTKGTLLAHTTSNEVMIKKMGTPSADTVGYAAIIF